MGSQYQGVQEFPKLAKVHSAPVRTTPTSNFQSLFQPTPKLYKYSPDQLQVVFHRRGEDEENTTTAALQPNTLNTERKTTKRSKKHSKLQKNQENKDNIGVNIIEEKCAENSENSCDMNNSLNLEQEAPTSMSLDSSPSKSSISECNSCDGLIAQLENAQVEINRLTKMLETKTHELNNVQTENKTLRIENKRLSISVEQVKNGMRQLSSTVVASNQNINEAKIMHLLHTASPSLDGEASFRRMSSNMKEIRERINKLNMSASGAGSGEKKCGFKPNDPSSLQKIKSPLKSISIFY